MRMGTGIQMCMSKVSATDVGTQPPIPQLGRDDGRGLDGVPEKAQLRQTPQQCLLHEALQRVSPEEAVASVRGAQTEALTEVTYRATEPVYVASCERADLHPRPLSLPLLEAFSGYLGESAAFAVPSVYWWAAVEATRDRAHHISLDKHRANGCHLVVRGAVLQ